MLIKIDWQTLFFVLDTNSPFEFLAKRTFTGEVTPNSEHTILKTWKMKVKPLSGSSRATRKC